MLRTAKNPVMIERMKEVRVAAYGIASACSSTGTWTSRFATTGQGGLAMSEPRDAEAAVKGQEEHVKFLRYHKARNAEIAAKRLEEIERLTARLASAEKRDYVEWRKAYDAEQGKRIEELSARLAAAQESEDKWIRAGITLRDRLEQIEVVVKQVRQYPPIGDSEWVEFLNELSAIVRKISG